MNSTIGATGPSDYGMLGSLVSNAVSVKQKLDTLTNQASTGLVSNTYAGLGSGAPVSLDLRPQIANLQTWQNNVNAATGPMGVAQATLTQIESIASDFYAQLNNVQSVSTSEVDSIAANARDALSQVANLLDSQYGGTYVFAGQDTGNAPVPDPDHILTSGFYQQINTAVGNLSVNGAAVTANATYATAVSNAAGTSPFSGSRNPTRTSGCTANSADRPEPDGNSGYSRQRQWADPDLIDRIHHHCWWTTIINRLVYARCAARAGDHRLAEQLAGERHRLRGSGAGHTR